MGNTWNTWAPFTRRRRADTARSREYTGQGGVRDARCGGGATRREPTRTVKTNHRLIEYKQQARDRLTSEKGLKHRSNRPIEPEAVFGQMKHDMQYKRFRHFGKDKVTMDFAFFATALNIKKMIRTMKRAA